MKGNPDMKKDNGITWGILTPILLCFLSMMATLNQSTMNRMHDLIEKQEKHMSKVEKRLLDHLTDPRIHYALSNEVKYLKETVDRIEGS